MELHKDPELLAAFKRGDREVLGALYNEHRPAVLQTLARGFSFKSGKNGELVRFQGFSEPYDLQEVTQDGFLRAFRESARLAYDGKRPFRPYLITIVRNLVIDHFRRKSLERSLFVTLARVAGESEAPEGGAKLTSSAQKAESPAETAERTQLSDALQEFIGNLEPDDQKVVQLHMMGELSQVEIATELGTDRNGIRKRIKRIRESLLRHLKQKGFIDSLDQKEVFQTMLIIIGIL